MRKFLFWPWRMSIKLNDEAENLAVLPPADESIGSSEVPSAEKKPDIRGETWRRYILRNFISWALLAALCAGFYYLGIQRGIGLERQRILDLLDSLRFRPWNEIVPQKQGVQELPMVKGGDHV